MRIVLLSLCKVKFCINQKLLFILKHTLKLVHYTVAEMYAKPFCTLRMRINQNNNSYSRILATARDDADYILYNMTY